MVSEPIRQRTGGPIKLSRIGTSETVGFRVLLREAFRQNQGLLARQSPRTWRLTRSRVSFGHGLRQIDVAKAYGSVGQVAFVQREARNAVGSAA